MLPQSKESMRWLQMFPGTFNSYGYGLEATRPRSLDAEIQSEEPTLCQAPSTGVSTLAFAFQEMH